MGSLESQIVIGDVESFLIVEEKGRGLIDRVKFLDAVRRVLSLSDSRLADCLGVHRQTVWRYRTDPGNASVIEEARAYLGSFSDGGVPPSKMTWEYFQALPHIRRWKEAMDRRMVSEAKQRGLMRSFFNLCKYMKVLPSKVKVEQCAQVVLEQRDRYNRGEPQIKGIAYSIIREAVRGFFMSVRNLSGMHLTNLGIGKEALKGSGKYSRQYVPQEVRHKFEWLLLQKMEEELDKKYLEALGNCKFNFSTGTRISASLAFSFRDHQYELTPTKWMFEIWDKGSRGKKKRWEKILMGGLLDHFKDYCTLRFRIAPENLEAELPRVTNHLFPSFVDGSGKVRDGLMRDLVKPLLVEAGLQYKDFPPTHIWRHTFAQEMLRATDHNYELVASLGGWVNTAILKKHYGEMGECAREQGLMKALGMEILEVKRELAW